MRTSVGERLQAATGLVFVLLSLIAVFSLPPRPAPGAPANEIVSYYTVHSSAVKFADYLFLLGLLFALWFIGYLRTVFAQAEGEPHHLSTLFFGSGVAVVAVGMVFWGMGLALAGQAADLGVIKALSEVVTFGMSITFLLDFLHVGTASVLVLRTGVLPRWVGVFGVVVAVAQLLGSLSLMTAHLWNMQSQHIPGDERTNELEMSCLAVEMNGSTDHDTAYHFSFPASLPQLLAWARLLSRVQRGELEP